MKLIRCPRNHLYDHAVYTSCPFCRGIPDSPNHTAESGETIALQKKSAEEDDQYTVYLSPEEQVPQLRDDMTFPAPREELDDDGKTEWIPGLSRTEPVPVPEYDRSYRSDSEPYFSGRAGIRETEQRPVRDAFSGTPTAAPERTALLYKSKVDPVVGWLVCLCGASTGQSFPLKSGQNFVGRSPEMDVVLKGEDSVSGINHAVVVFDPEKTRFYAVPGQSSGLTYRNGELLLMPAPLYAYDVLRFGDAEYVFVPLCNEHFSWKKYL